MHMNSRTILLLACVCVAVLSFTCPTLAQLPYATAPSWISLDEPTYSTGAGWADINRDGWPDLVIANGNDMARGRLAVYYNAKGTLPRNPDWQSQDIDFHGHLSIGDVNHDGYPDVAVSVFLGAAGFSQKGKVKLYMNKAGTLESLPSWTSQDSMYTFSCAFGDADNDGDLDLAVACGEAYNRKADVARIYYNRNGRLDSLPGWKSMTPGYSLDIGWGDFDADGKLDLVVANEITANIMFHNFGDSIGVVPAWESQDGRYANSLFVSDANKDGYPELFISDNNQLGGTGKFKMYSNTAGTLSAVPAWTSAFTGYGSGITLADVDSDGDPDLVTGGWWQPCRIYPNNGGTFPAQPSWTSTTSSVVEAIVFCDVDRDGIDTLRPAFTGDGTRRLYQIEPHPLEDIVGVAVGTVMQPPGSYCFDLESGWISFAQAPPAGVDVNIVALTSHDPDFAVSNWDNDLGNFLFLNTGTTATPALPGKSSGFRILDVFPNPGSDRISVEFTNESPGCVDVCVTDLVGRECLRRTLGVVPPGTHRASLELNDLRSGLYTVQIMSYGKAAVRLVHRL
jgi:hypothetical protein